MPARSRAAARRLDPASVFVLGAFAGIEAVAHVLGGVSRWIDLLYAGASALCFVLHAVDKSAAINGRDRVAEAALLWLCAAGGWPGAIVAQQLLRHKTAKRPFRLRFWLAVLANLVLFASLALPRMH